MTKRTGRLKWYSINKGFGFIILDDGTDALLPASAVRAFGSPAIMAHSIITGEVEKGKLGLFIKTLFKIDAPPATEAEGFVRVTVKWYNREKGFGFATQGENNPDIFIHAETLKISGIASTHEGQELLVRIIQTDNGFKAQDVREALPAVVS